MIRALRVFNSVTEDLRLQNSQAFAKFTKSVGGIF
jgi:hypothetical protein